MEERIIAIEARSIVHELLIACLVVEVSRHLQNDVEAVRRIMRPVEEQLLAALREAEAGNRPLIESAHRYFSDFSAGLINALPHHGNH